MLLRALQTACTGLPDGTEYTIHAGVAYNDNDPVIRDLLKRHPDWFEKSEDSKGRR